MKLTDEQLVRLMKHATVVLADEREASALCGFYLRLLLALNSTGSTSGMALVETLRMSRQNFRNQTDQLIALGLLEKGTAPSKGPRPQSTFAPPAHLLIPTR